MWDNIFSLNITVGLKDFANPCILFLVIFDSVQSLWPLSCRHCAEQMCGLINVLMAAPDILDFLRDFSPLFLVLTSARSHVFQHIIFNGLYTKWPTISGVKCCVLVWQLMPKYLCVFVFVRGLKKKYHSNTTHTNIRICKQCTYLVHILEHCVVFTQRGSKTSLWWPSEMSSQDWRAVMSRLAEVPKADHTQRHMHTLSHS